jgi:hypothetical protein
MPPIPAPGTEGCRRIDVYGLPSIVHVLRALARYRKDYINDGIYGALSNVLFDHKNAMKGGEVIRKMNRKER